jgi:hypothetical protein
MRKLFFIHYYFAALVSYAQPVITDSSLLIKPGFNPGETKTYLVTEESKTGPPILKASNQFKISFTVLDTIKGYTIVYKVKTIKTTNKRSTLESIVAKISNNIQLVYKIGSQGWATDLFNIEEIRKQLIRALDSVTLAENFHKRDRILISHLRESLEKIDGVQICLGPLMIFNNVFRQAEFHNRRGYGFARRFDIFNQPQLPGVLMTELKRINWQDNTALVIMNFKGNQDSAAKSNAPYFQKIYSSIKGKSFNTANLPTKMRNDFERKYDIILSSAWPKKIFDKDTKVYLGKVTKKTLMILTDD